MKEEEETERACTGVIGGGGEPTRDVRGEWENARQEVKKGARRALREDVCIHTLMEVFLGIYSVAVEDLDALT